jgi:hypothetical protein
VLGAVVRSRWLRVLRFDLVPSLVVGVEEFCEFEGGLGSLDNGYSHARLIPEVSESLDGGDGLVSSDGGGEGSEKVRVAVLLLYEYE